MQGGGLRRGGGAVESKLPVSLLFHFFTWQRRPARPRPRSAHPRWMRRGLTRRWARSRREQTARRGLPLPPSPSPLAAQCRRWLAPAPPPALSRPSWRVAHRGGVRSSLCACARARETPSVCARAPHTQQTRARPSSAARKNFVCPLSRAQRSLRLFTSKLMTPAAPLRPHLPPPRPGVVVRRLAYHPHPPRPIAASAKGGRGRHSGGSSTADKAASSFGTSSSSTPPKLVHVSPDASDAWRLEPVIAALREGGVRLWAF